MSRRTPLYEQHQAAGARFVDFGDWLMPVQYQGIRAEHLAVRGGAGIFDVSHMGEIEIRGEAVAAFDRLIANDLTATADGQALYTAMCTPEGGIVDDLVVYRFSEARVLVCCNASNRAKDLAWIEAHLAAGAQVLDRGDDWAQLALQGPRAEAILQPLTDLSLPEIGRYWFATGEVAGIGGVLCSRTGYTGEDGFELYLPPDRAGQVWDALLAQGGEVICPVGLGARDTLRLEMRYLLYGNDIDETTTPLEAGIGWATKLDRGDFLGRAALLDQRARGLERRLVGFVMDGRAPARHGYPVVDEAGAPIGEVTSGTRSPSTGQNIGLAYVPVGQHRRGHPIHVKIRGRVEAGRVVKTPFYHPRTHRLGGEGSA